MPTVRLTQLAIERLKKPAKGRTIHWDKLLPGFGLRISASGTRSWIAMYRVGGKAVMETLGTVAKIPEVGDARALARASMTTAAGGKNPVVERKTREQNTAASTVCTVADRYIERYAKKHTRSTTWKEAKRQFDKDVFPKWGDRPIASITRQDVARMLESIEDRGSPVQANRTLARLKTLFAWAMQEEIITQDPTAHVDKVTKENTRDRVLTDREIGLFWEACDAAGWPFGAMGKLLLLTAQRRNEVSSMRWGELDLEKRIWTIPRERAKNDRAHEVYLNDLALEVIEGLPRLDAEPRYVLTTTGRTPVSGYSKARATIDRHMLAQLRREISEAGGDVESAEIPPWTFHDLRRTAASSIARLNTPPHVVDRVLNHVSGTIRGVAAVYNRHAYIDERRAALQQWGRFVEALVRPGAGNVVQLAAAG